MAFVPLDTWQYRIARDLPDGHSLPDGWKVQVGDDLPLVKVHDRSGAPVGILLGFPIDLDMRRIVDTDWTAPGVLGADVAAFADQVLLALGGRFLFVLATENVQRIYTDISAQVTCVYDTRTKMVGSTAHALFDDGVYQSRFNKELFDALDVDGEGWFPCELTAHDDLYRLYSNFYFDLATFNATRFWPGPDRQAPKSTEEIVDACIDIIQAQIEALVKGPKKVALALTAGVDSRTVLACARPFMDEISCVTIIGQDRHAIDSVMAKKMTSALGIDHITLPRRAADQKQKDLFIRRGGHCNGDSNSKFHPSVWPLKDDYVFVGGVGGAVMYTPYLRPTEGAQTDLPADRILARLGFRSIDRINAALQKRIDAMQARDTFEMLDLVHLEERCCAWYASQFCCDPTLVRHAPLLTTRSVRLMMQLPQDWKRSKRFGREVIAKAWPELDKFEYNSLGRWRDTWIKAQRAFDDPKLIFKKFRKLRG